MGRRRGRAIFILGSGRLVGEGVIDFLVGVRGRVVRGVVSGKHSSDFSFPEVGISANIVNDQFFKLIENQLI